MFFSLICWLLHKPASDLWEQGFPLFETLFLLNLEKLRPDIFKAFLKKHLLVDVYFVSMYFLFCVQRFEKLPLGFMMITVLFSDERTHGAVDL